MSIKPVDETKLDALLRAWPALDDQGRALPPDGDMAWDERADAIVAAARAATTDHSAVELVLAAPNLPAEPGEPGQSNQAFRAGESSMSDSEGSAGSKPPPSLSSSGAGPSSMPRPRQSLREIAERASQSVRTPLPSAPGATPLPGRASQPSSPPGSVRAQSSPSIANAPKSSAAATPIPAPSRRPIEAGSSDSGVVDLNIINAAADATARAAAEKAKPAEASLFDDDAPASKRAAAGAAAVAKDKAKDVAKTKAKPVLATPAAPAKSGGGAMIGIVIALVGVAAAFAIWQVRKGASEVAHEDTTKPAMTADAPKPEATATAKPEAVAQAAPTAAEDQGLDPSALPDQQHAAAAARGGARVPGPLPKAAESAAPSAVAVVEPAPKKGSAVGTLNEEMQKATGTDGKSKGGEGEPEFAGGDTRSKTLPEHPSPGAVQAAIGTVLGGAKACVAEADEATVARVTFKSSGEVSGVTVTGWASANGKSGCVVSALKGARVGAFTDASYSFPVSIRP